MNDGAFIRWIRWSTALSPGRLVRKRREYADASGVLSGVAILELD